MTLAQLKYFCMAVRYHNITEAAKALFVTQPTISIAIRDLEKEFSIKLFSGSGKHLTLSEEGELFYAKASDILRACDDLHAEFSNPLSTWRRVRIGIPPLLSTVFFPQLLDAFRLEHPDTWLELNEYPSVQACDLVLDERLDMALVSMDIHNIDKFSTHLMLTDTLVFCVTKHHPLAGLDTLDLRLLHEQPIIIYSRNSVQNLNLQARLDSLNVSPRVVMHSSQAATILNFLRKGDCGCFLFSSMLPQYPELKGIPADPPIEAHVGLVWKKGRYLGAGTQAFLDFCRKVDIEEKLSLTDKRQT